MTQENEAQPEEFSTIWNAMWWCMSCMTTVGYGDKTPVTAQGRIVACLTSVTSVVAMALPTCIVGSGFIETMVDDSPDLSLLTDDEVAEAGYELVRSKETGGAVYVLRRDACDAYDGDGDGRDRGSGDSSAGVDASEEDVQGGGGGKKTKNKKKKSGQHQSDNVDNNNNIYPNEGEGGGGGGGGSSGKAATHWMDPRGPGADYNHQRVISWSSLGGVSAKFVSQKILSLSEQVEELAKQQALLDKKLDAIAGAVGAKIPSGDL